MPVGVADTKGYTNWVTAAKLDPSVKDVGTRGEASVDAIVALNPDLVITTTDEAANTIAQMEKATPVLVIRGADAANAIPQMKTNLDLIGQAVGKSEQAKQLNADFDKAVADGKQKIADAGKAGTGFTMADGYKQGSTISIRMYTTGSLLGAVTTELGLKNGWTGAGDKDYGLAQTDLEGLTKLPDGAFLYIANKNDGGDVFGGDLAEQRDLEEPPVREVGPGPPPSGRHLDVRRTEVDRAVHRRRSPGSHLLTQLTAPAPEVDKPPAAGTQDPGRGPLRARVRRHRRACRRTSDSGDLIGRRERPGAAGVRARDRQRGERAGGLAAAAVAGRGARRCWRWV